MKWLITEETLCPCDFLPWVAEPFVHWGCASFWWLTLFSDVMFAQQNYVFVVPVPLMFHMQSFVSSPLLPFSWPLWSQAGAGGTSEFFSQTASCTKFISPPPIPNNPSGWARCLTTRTEHGWMLQQHHGMLPLLTAFGQKPWAANKAHRVKNTNQATEVNKICSYKWRKPCSWQANRAGILSLSSSLVHDTNTDAGHGWRLLTLSFSDRVVKASVPDRLCQQPMPENLQQYRTSIFSVFRYTYRISVCSTCMASCTRNAWIFSYSRGLCTHAELWPWLSRVCKPPLWHTGVYTYICTDTGLQGQPNMLCNRGSWTAACSPLYWGSLSVTQAERC